MRRLLSFHGRAGRSSYFWIQFGLYAPAYIGMFLLIFGLVALDVGVPAADIPSYVPKADMPRALALAVASTGGLLMMIVIWTTVATDIRRLHDIGLSGWFVLLSFVLTNAVPDPAHWPELMPSLGTILWEIALWLVPGTAGPNRYDTTDLEKFGNVF